MLSWGTPVIHFREWAPESPRESYTDNGFKVTRIFICDWKDRDDLVNALVGYPLRVTGGVSNDGTINRYLPHPYHPNNNETPIAYAVRVPTVEPFGKPTNETQTADAPAPIYTKAKLTVEYEGTPYDVITDDQVKDPDWPGGNNETKRYCIFGWKPKVEFLNIPMGNYRIAGTTTPVGQTIQFAQHDTDFVCVWKQLPGVPYDVGKYMGTVHYAGANGEKPLIFQQTRYMNGGGSIVQFTFGADTAMLVDAEIRPYVSPVGDRLFDITYRWQVLYDQDATHQKIRYYQKGPPASWPYTLISTDGSSTYTASPLNFLRVRKDHRYLFKLSTLP